MAESIKSRVQGEFLAKVQKDKTNVEVFLSNGFRLTGTVKDYDQYCVLIMSKGKENLIYKSALSTIAPIGTLTH